jgi:hypothetical protein
MSAMTYFEVRLVTSDWILAYRRISHRRVPTNICRKGQVQVKGWAASLSGQSSRSNCAVWLQSSTSVRGLVASREYYIHDYSTVRRLGAAPR